MAITKMPIGTFVSELKAAKDRKDGYIMGATGQNPKKWAATSWWFTQYSGSKKTKALYWRENAERVFDCNGLAEGLYKDYTGVDINTKARYNYANWCTTKGSGTIPVKYRVPGAAIFWGDKASTIHHVAYLVEPVVAGKPEGDWYIIEARGVMYGVVQTKLNSRKPNFWGLMEKYFDYGDVSTTTTTPTTTTYKLGSRVLKYTSPLMEGDDVKELQTRLNDLGFSCGTADGEFGKNTRTGVKAFQKAADVTVDGEFGPKSLAALEAYGKNSASGNTVTITGNSVNIRKGPGTSYGVLKVANKGNSFERVDVGTWSCVEYNGGLYWASSKYISNGVCTASSLNIRKGPGTSYDTVGAVKKGYKFAVINTSGWVPILISGVIYWVSAKYAE